MRAWRWVIVLLWAASTPAAAQAPARPLEVPRTSSWKHAHTEVILPPVLAGLNRMRVVDTGQSELDVLAEYESADGGLTSTLYLFRSQVPNAPLWFDRATIVLDQMKRFPIVKAGALPVRSFAIPGAPAESGLRVVYPISGGSYSSTAVAVTSFNGWMAKIRISSKSLDAAALDQKLTEFLAAVRWPKTIAATRAVPVEDCPTPLVPKRAKMVKPDFADVLAGSLLGIAASMKRGPDDIYCRDPEQTVRYGVYRGAASSDAYLLALADSGRALSVGRSFSLEKGKSPPYGVTYLDLDVTAVFPSFRTLPQAEQVVGLLGKTQPMSMTKVGTTETTVNASAIK